MESDVMTLPLNQWLTLTSVFRCILVEIDYLDAGEMKTACFARGNFRSAGNDMPAYTPYRDFVIGGLQFAQSIDSVLFGQSQTDIGDIELALQAESEALLTRAVAGNQIRLYIGEEHWPKSAFYRLATVVSKSVEPSSDVIRVVFRNFAENLDKPVLTQKTADGVLLPRCFGRAFNITPVLIDAATHTYQFNIGASQAVTAAKFNGDRLSESDYELDLAASTIRFKVMPVGEITLDVDGTKTGSESSTWLQSAGDIIKHLFPNAVIDADVPSYLLGLYLSDEMTYVELLDLVTSSVGAYWYFDAFGVLQVKRFVGLTGIDASLITDDQNELDSRHVSLTLAPAKSISLGYGRNYTQLRNVAGNVYTTDAAMAERLKLEELKVSPTSDDVASAFNDALDITASTILVNKADASAEATRRLALSNQPRLIYETTQLAAGFAMNLGDEYQLTTPGINGDSAVITRKDIDLLNDTVVVELWQ